MESLPGSVTARFRRASAYVPSDLQLPSFPLIFLSAAATFSPIIPLIAHSFILLSPTLLFFPLPFAVPHSTLFAPVPHSRRCVPINPRVSLVNPAYPRPFAPEHFHIPELIPVSPSPAACCIPCRSSHPFITGPCSANPRGFCLFVLELLLQLATDPTYFLTSHLNSRAALQLLHQLTYY